MPVFTVGSIVVMDVQTEEAKLARIAARLNRQNKLEAKLVKKRIYEAKEEVQRLVMRFLEIDSAIEKIVLFGSLAEDNISSSHFDIDLAVRSEQYLKLVSCGLTSAFRVDVVDLDHVTESIRISIEKYGKTIYEKNKK